MAKESRPSEQSNNQSAAKKRRVTKATSNNEPVVQQKTTETDLYSEVVAYEENEAKERNADEDAELYYKICGDINGIMLEIAQLKLKPPENASALIREKQIEASLKILMLKKLNRLEKVRTKESRTALQKAREQVDNDHLHLQNMVYEVVHLTKEVKKCLEFKSKDEDINLVPVEEFYKEAPESVTKPEITKKNEHELKLARLQWELLQRKELAAQCKKLESNKEAVGKDIEAKKQQLNSLGPALKAVLDATKPLQENLGVPLDKIKKIHEKALLLPKALYVLFVQADAYSQISKWVTANITGECDKTLMEEMHLDDISSADSDSENENHDDLGVSHRRKVNFQDRRKSGGNSNPSDKIEQKKKECMKKHPLSVVIKITLETGEILSLEFQWLILLEIVCVLPTVTAQDSSGIAAEDLLSSRNILSSLFPGDTGENCPNPSTYYQLRRAGLDTFPSSISTLGIPYRWAQELCGINFLTPTPESNVNYCQKNLENILKSIKNRFTDRLILAKEVKQLEHGYSITEKKMLTVLTSFITITYQDFSRVPSSQQFLKDNILDSTFIFYKTQLQVGSAKMLAYIAVSPDYPKQTPLFLLELQYKGTFNSLNCDALRNVERELNVHINELDDESDKAYGLLIRQIRKFIFCTEIFMHIEYPNEMPIQVTYFRKYHGKSRIHPYKYLLTAGGIYTHR